MSRHVCTFEIASETDAHAVRLAADAVHDTLREELKRTDRDDTDLEETLAGLRQIRRAARDPSPGEFTVTYEPRGEPFESE